MPTNTQPTANLPAGIADVALIDCKAAAASAAISVSKFHQMVAAGLAPQPAFRSPRCTRWRAASIRAWLIDLADQSGDSRTVSIAKKASAASQAKRRAGRPDQVEGP